MGSYSIYSVYFFYSQYFLSLHKSLLFGTENLKLSNDWLPNYLESVHSSVPPLLPRTEPTWASGKMTSTLSSQDQTPILWPPRGQKMVFRGLPVLATHASMPQQVPIHIWRADVPVDAAPTIPVFVRPLVMPRAHIIFAMPQIPQLQDSVFFDAYIMYKNGDNGISTCTYYMQQYGPSYATNHG